MNDDKDIYEDYLSEFDESISFDSEICPFPLLEISDKHMVTDGFSEYKIIKIRFLQF
jgi:hypothetical protein